MIILFLIPCVLADIQILPPKAPYAAAGAFAPTFISLARQARGLLVANQSKTYYGLNFILCSTYIEPGMRLDRCQLSNLTTRNFTYYGSLFTDGWGYNFTNDYKPLIDKRYDELIFYEGFNNAYFQKQDLMFLKNIKKFYKYFYQLSSLYDNITYISTMKKAVLWGNKITAPQNASYVSGVKLTSLCFTLPFLHHYADTPTVKLQVLIDGKVVRTVYTANTTNFYCEPLMFDGTTVQVKLPRGKFIREYGLSTSFYLFEGPRKKPRVVHVIPQCDIAKPMTCEGQAAACNATANCLLHQLGFTPTVGTDSSHFRSITSYIRDAFEDSVYCIYKFKQWESLICNFSSLYYTPFISNSPFLVWMRNDSGVLSPINYLNKILDMSRGWDIFDINYGVFDYYDPYLNQFLSEGFKWFNGTLVKITNVVGEDWYNNVDINMVGLSLGLISILIGCMFLCSCYFNRQLQKLKR